MGYLDNYRGVATTMKGITLHPVQVKRNLPRVQPKINSVVTLQAYEVYSYVFAPQQALITNGCRGGFGANELIAFLYAYPFPKAEWRTRVDEALNGMIGL